MAIAARPFHLELGTTVPTPRISCRTHLFDLGPNTGTLFREPRKGQASGEFHFNFPLVWFSELDQLQRETCLVDEQTPMRQSIP